jgi:crotonobetainyl-CoA:carnitine CoA-transferase CaiB-like acyl-CoA transferase
MNERKKPTCFLDSYRVLDLTDEKGLLCGKLMGDMGADVIKIERPGGDPARDIGPFYKDDIHPEKSLFWFALNLNKRGITLNIETDDGSEILKRLVATADFLIESFTPGYLEGLGLGYPDLEAINPRLIMVSISPFGQTGPYAHYKAPDIVGMAMGGMMQICGDPDRPPVRVSHPQAYYFAAADGVVGAMAAHYHREATGEGQQVDVSMQESVVPLAMTAPLLWEFYRINQKRGGSEVISEHRLEDGTTSTTRLRTVWPTKDGGYVQYTVMGGVIGAPSSRALAEAMDEAGMAPEEFKNTDWEGLNRQTMTQEKIDMISEPIGRYFAAHSTMEIYEEAVKRRIILAPLSTTGQIQENDQLRDRGAWVEVPHPELGTSIRYPGDWARMNETPLSLRRRAPLIGEHNQEIYDQELGISKEQIALLKGSRVI